MSDIFKVGNIIAFRNASKGEAIVKVLEKPINGVFKAKVIQGIWNNDDKEAGDITNLLSSDGDCPWYIKKGCDTELWRVLYE